ncbi:MAG: hypothetical protein K1X36_13670 [Pyrinomonadaceae bacterium]|nr:hypothetical protein [Pyrinomonadaceae bacterium]
MPKDSDITPQNFKLLLDWLDPDEELAALKYEKIRQRIIKILQFRGCYEAEPLTNDIFDRVVSKMPEISTSFVGEPALYFFGVAKLALFEWRRKLSKRSLPTPAAPRSFETDATDATQDCLAVCLREISEKNREILISYYSYNNSSEKALHRVNLAKSQGLSMSALQIRAFRVRNVVGECIKNCLNN